MGENPKVNPRRQPCKENKHGENPNANPERQHSRENRGGRKPSVFRSYVTDLQVQGSYLGARETALQRKRGREKTHRKNKNTWAVKFDHRFCKLAGFQEAEAIPGGKEKTLRKNEKTKWVGFNPRVLQLSGFRFSYTTRASYKGAKARVFQDIKFSLFEHDSDKKIMGFLLRIIQLRRAHLKNHGPSSQYHPKED
jgi:hypothetical protein